MKRCKNTSKSIRLLNERRAALRKELTQYQQVIADGTNRKLDDASLEKAWKIFQDLTGYSEDEILDKVSKSQPTPLTWLQEVELWLYKIGAIIKAFWKVICEIIILGAAVVTILNYFGILPI